jgi:hypothetical protein
MFLGRRERTARSLHSSFTRRENLNKCLVQARWRTSRRKSRRNTLPETADAWRNHSGKNLDKIRSQGESVS